MTPSQKSSKSVKITPFPFDTPMWFIPYRHTASYPPDGPGARLPPAGHREPQRLLVHRQCQRLEHHVPPPGRGPAPGLLPGRGQGPLEWLGWGRGACGDPGPTPAPSSPTRRSLRSVPSPISAHIDAIWLWIVIPVAIMLLFPQGAAGPVMHSARGPASVLFSRPKAPEGPALLSTCSPLNEKVKCPHSQQHLSV